MAHDPPPRTDELRVVGQFKNAGWRYAGHGHRLTAEPVKEKNTTVPDSLATDFLWLFVIFLGIAFGAGIYEGRIRVCRWLSCSEDSGRHWNAGEARRDDTGRRF